MAKVWMEPLQNVPRHMKHSMSERAAFDYGNFAGAKRFTTTLLIKLP